jgi:hypothetical protein
VFSEVYFSFLSGGRSGSFDGYFANNKLTSIIIPDSVAKIGVGAFSNNKLTNLNIPNSLTSIGNEAFFYNPLVELVIGDKITSIANIFNNSREARYVGGRLEGSGKINLTKVTIGDNVEVFIPIGYKTSNLDNINSFSYFYLNNKKKAGIYTFERGRWRYSQR